MSKIDPPTVRAAKDEPTTVGSEPIAINGRLDYKPPPKKQLQHAPDRPTRSLRPRRRNPVVGAAAAPIYFLGSFLIDAGRGDDRSAQSGQPVPRSAPAAIQRSRVSAAGNSRFNARNVRNTVRPDALSSLPLSVRPDFTCAVAISSPVSTLTSLVKKPSECDRAEGGSSTIGRAGRRGSDPSSPPSRTDRIRRRAPPRQGGPSISSRGAEPIGQAPHGKPEKHTDSTADRHGKGDQD